MLVDMEKTSWRAWVALQLDDSKLINRKRIVSKTAITLELVVVEAPCIMCVQYVGGCSVHRGDPMSTSGDLQFNGGIS